MPPRLPLKIARSSSTQPPMKWGSRFRVRNAKEKKTADKVIRREIPILEGDLYSETGKEGAEGMVMRLGYFESVVVSLRTPDHAIAAAEVLDAAGNRMLYQFSKLQRNRGLTDDLFRFEAPEGTTVVGSH